jgi:alkylation response protein AidB-like acyl-CoA dehydrogenase
MDLEFTPADIAFRDEVRAFIAENYPKKLKGVVAYEGLTKEDFLAWHRVLHKKGWIAPSWPKKFGGTGWSVTQRYIFQEECARAETIPVLPFGLMMVGPVIYSFANEAQKKRFLPRILSGEDWWCQGYSEPGAGSDLASLKAKAVREGDDYVVNGAKTWTTLAQYADWIFCLVRTNPAAKAQEGISFLLIDMKSKGVTVRPILTMEGGHEVNEVFLDNVRVPVENRIGEENKGWTYAKFLLVHERSGIAQVARSKKAVERLKRFARAELQDGAPLIEDAMFRSKVADLEIDLLALEYTELRTLADEAAGRHAGPQSSVLKIKGSEIQQRITELTLEAAGYHAFPDALRAAVGDNLGAIGPEGAWGSAAAYFNMRKTSIYGGTNEIQRNIMAKFVLGL